MKVKDLKQDGHNYRKHSDRNKALIKKSVEECGLGRSVVIDADGVLIAGNGVASVLDKHTPVRVVETDGSELVVVKRTDLHEGDVRRKKLAMADNAAADRVEWNVEELHELNDFGVDLSEWDIPLPTESATSGLAGYDEKEQKEKSYNIVYEIAFNDESEQEKWFDFLRRLKRDMPDVATISERLLIVAQKYMNEND